MNPMPEKEWWKDEARLQVWRQPQVQGGLASDQAAQRLAEVGPNRFGQTPAVPGWRQYLRHFRNPLVVTLLLASAVSAATGEATNFFIIACIVLLSVTLDFWQEMRAGQVVERLRRSVAVRASVLRDGQWLDHPVADLVPGDVVQLSAGDLVPADALVLKARDFFVNQSVLTGESWPVEKRVGMPTPLNDLQDATHAVFMGSSVVSGMAQVVLVRTGSGTAMGEVASSLNQAPEPTSFEMGMRRFGMLILRLTFLLVLFVLLVNGLMGRPLLESFLFAVALAVGLTPELLPMVVSVTLSRGAMRMAQQAIVVKRPSAIQDLGSMDVLCTDKTGTLTEARIRMERHVDPQGRSSDRSLELAWLNSHFESGLRSPLDEAILQNRSFDASVWTKIDEVPFDFERRRVSVLIERTPCPGERELVVKGAPDDILGLCTRYEDGDASKAMDDAALERVHATCHALEDEGFRVLAIAWRPVPLTHDHAVVNDESELVLVGFAAFLDPPKESAAVALQALQQAGVAIKVVTGDSDRVTQHVCHKLGLPVQGVLTGAQIAQLSDEALRAKVATVNLFCRVNPTQKNRVIQAIRARGHVVGYMGDGVNDAPSLHSADVGLSVDSAVDVAKAAADMILLRPDLRILQDAVLEGRRTFGNILKYILMGTSSNFGNMFSMAGAVLFLPFLPMLPTQILLNNILYDLSELPIPFDAVDAQDTVQPRVMDMGLIQRFMFTIGPVSSLFDFITFAVLLKVFDASEALFQTGWFVESLCTQVLVIFVIRTRGNPLRSRPHPMLTATSLAIVALAMVLPVTPLGRAFGFTPLPAGFYAALAVMVLSYLMLVIWVRRLVEHHPA
ncbi:MAG: magnesium-translocating P-type ATPase [Limnohabitans sp.]